MARFQKPAPEYLMISSVALLWGSVGIFVRWVNLPGLEPVVVFWRLLFGLLFFVAVILARREFHLFHLGAHPLLLLSSGGILTLHWVLFFKAINLLYVSDAVFIVYLAPVLVAFLAPLLLKERLEGRTLVALALAISGVALTSLTGTNSAGGSFNLAGTLFALMAAVTYALLVIILKILREDTPALTVTFYQTGVGFLLLAPFAFLQDYSIRPAGWASLTTLGLVHVGLAGLIYVFAARKVKAQHIGIISYLEPLSATVLGLLFLGEQPGWEDLAGGLLIIVAGLVVLGQPARSGKPSETAPSS